MKLFKNQRVFFEYFKTKNSYTISSITYQYYNVYRLTIITSVSSDFNLPIIADIIFNSEKNTNLKRQIKCTI